jgi:hypothetical protein
VTQSQRRTLTNCPECGATAKLADEPVFCAKCEARVPVNRDTLTSTPSAGTYAPSAKARKLTQADSRPASARVPKE